jgi:hypothetical protein
MEYKVIPFVATLDQKKETGKAVADQLEKLITNHNGQGWTYVRLESVSTYVQADAGCFGIGATPARMTSYQMAVFSRKEL